MPLDTSIEFLKGVGPKRAQTLREELGVRNFEDLIYHFPFRYIDRSKFHQVSDIATEEAYVQLKVRCNGVKEIKQKRGSRLEVQVSDDSGQMKLVWFAGLKWIKPQLHEGKHYLVFGRPSNFKGRYSINHPEIQLVESDRAVLKGGLQPVYHSSEKLSAKGLDSRGIMNVQKTLIPKILPYVYENLPDEVVTYHRLMDRKTAIEQLHFPADLESMQKARFRLKFEELFVLQLSLLLNKMGRMEKNQGHVFSKVGSIFNDFYTDGLPFDLTGAQKRVIKEIRKDIGSGKQMNRLLQGDVGSGKTIVALLSMLIALDNGFQAALMAPTEILATQHYEGLKDLLKGTKVQISLLTGSTKVAKRRTLHQALEMGELHILIGTHALIEDKVKFQNLGLVIIDEQHRFGVAQRAKLWRKNKIAPHILIMTATPIPRTLAMTFYGELDTSVIDELPPGRKLIKTMHRHDSARDRVFKFIEDEIAKGRQVYVVYPLIEQSEQLDYKDLMDGFESLSRRFPMPKYQIGILNGKMKSDDKDFEMQRFVNGETQILVSTTVIEVGVNVPNASVMIIESAERFGLSQLHQLRGRVGRGGEQSYCVLMTGYKLSSDGRTRMETMVRTNDGFEIAEVDLELRGPGNIMGTKQSGLPDMRVADLAKDGPIMGMAREAALKLIADDPKISKSENRRLIPDLERVMATKEEWAKIS
jgi:ATP-dependent DNA helicase RecG